jgi:calcineurin-like phosphoesterase family protein
MRIVLMADTHLGRIQAPRTQVEKELVRIGLLYPDAVFHLGDVVDCGNDHYDDFLKIFRDVCPDALLLGVPGNHDNFRMFRDLFDRSWTQHMEEDEALSLAVEIGGLKFFFVDANCGHSVRAGKDNGDSGKAEKLRQTTIEWLEEQIISIQDGHKAVIITHYPVCNDDKRGIKANHPFSRRLLDLLKRYPGKIGRVFHGHVHNPVTCYSGGDAFSHTSVPSLAYSLPPADNTGFGILSLPRLHNLGDTICLTYRESASA